MKNQGHGFWRSQQHRRARLPAGHVAGRGEPQSSAALYSSRPASGWRCAARSLCRLFSVRSSSPQKKPPAGLLQASSLASPSPWSLRSGAGCGRLLFPYTVLLQTVPIVAIAPLIILWVGAGIFAVTVVTFIICLAPIIANTTQGLISVDENLIHLFLMYNASPSQILFKLRLPNALPSLFTGIRISAGISVIGAITGELFAGSTRVGEGGLGYAIIYANNQMETAYLFALVACRHGTRLLVLLYRHVSGVAGAAQLA
jgi:ABC-type nitrate/sulfonate/bicarbonate transport system permease component